MAKRIYLLGNRVQLFFWFHFSDKFLRPFPANFSSCAPPKTDGAVRFGSLFSGLFLRLHWFAKNTTGGVFGISVQPFSMTSSRWTYHILIYEETNKFWWNIFTTDATSTFAGNGFLVASVVKKRQKTNIGCIGGTRWKKFTRNGPQLQPKNFKIKASLHTKSPVLTCQEQQDS